jgi:diguanylate cyclase
VNLDGRAEFDRLASLYRTGLLDSRPEAAYDAIVETARDIVGVPIALVSLVDKDRQWFKACVGLEIVELPRETAFCSHAIKTPDVPFVVEDAIEDERFIDNPLVVGDPRIRFYAGFPISDDEGRGLGTMCVIDREPRRLTTDQMQQLQRLATVAQELVRLRVRAQDLDEARSRAVLFERGFDAAGVGNQLVDQHGHVLRVNQAFADMIGSSPDDLVGREWSEFRHPNSPTPGLDPNDATDPIDETDPIGKDFGTESQREIGQYLHADGRAVWAITQVVPVFFEGAIDPIRYVQVTNITDTVEAQQRAEQAMAELHRSERLWASLVEPSPDPVVRLSAEGVIEAMNAAAIGALSPDGTSRVGEHISTLAVTADMRAQVWALVTAALNTQTPREIEKAWFQPMNGSPLWCRVRILPITDPVSGARSAYFTATNITNAVEKEQRLATLARTDPLTGAANRVALTERLHDALARLDRGESAGVGIAMIDLDHFKEINDQHGHEIGDGALVAVVTSLRSVIRAQDTVARFGGDEFIVLFDNIDEHDMLEPFAVRLREQFGQINVGPETDRTLVAGSIGIAWSDEVKSGRELIWLADRALLEAKRRGRNRVWIAERKSDPPTGVSA